ncbi:putative phosphohistidine phosphatase protein [Magnetospira sp. QH-2]|nr:putative phosphohistidine phosphatase protein [Magnetospira sp. QH-2]
MARDFDRPLAGRGRRSALAMAEFLAREDLHPDMVLCSAACRARETLDHIQTAWNWAGNVCVEHDLYGMDAPGLITRLQRLPESLESVMVIGHNPTMEATAHTLVGNGPDKDMADMRAKFPTAALAMIKFDIPDMPWTELAPETGTLIRFVKPRDL